ncbi:hypothetical protein NHX12_030526 [Muraenolepis orangiensis]|uniref:RHD domain-containing protein n=1 Tax=Muraenolepis orangiensis TaxID=630683 RepID=A0A9Q0EBX7_9TELE|nr:hypothetical protein NHX12_030526 [Muraenolepis orangiensis]
MGAVRRSQAWPAGGAGGRAAEDREESLGSRYVTGNFQWGKVPNPALSLADMMAGDDLYLNNNQHQLFAEIPETLWELSNYNRLTQSTALRTADGPFLQIIEQPKQRGFRFRYGCEGPSHGGLPGASSEKNRKSFPTVKVCNYQGPARVVVQLVTASSNLAHLHAHSLVGKQCDKGICIADLPLKDSTIRGVSIHPEIDSLQGEVRSPRELTEHQRSLISSSASHQSKDMDLSVVRLMFTAFLPNSDGGFSRRLEPVVSEPIYDSKAPNASNLKIVRMDRTAGCVTGGEEVYLLCDKVQKEDDNGMTWEALGDFSPTDVHRQFAIVFKTPKYRDLSLQKPTSVFVQLKRKSDNETSEPKPFTYYPLITDKEEVAIRDSRPITMEEEDTAEDTLLLWAQLRQHGAFISRPVLPRADQHIRVSFAADSWTPQRAAVEDCSDDQPGEDPAPGGTPCSPAPPGDPQVRETEEPCEDTLDEESRASRQVEALYQYALTGDPAYLLAPQRPLLTTQDQDGDTGLHLGVIHSQGEVVKSLAQVLSSLPGEDVLNKRNHLYQTPLHLAVITQQTEAIEALLLAGADATLTDRHGNTLLHLAAGQVGGAMVAGLLRHKPVAQLVDLPNTAGLCALHLAVLANSLSAVRDLLGGGASVETAERSSGRTALHLATEMDNVSLAGCLLLEGNADVNCSTFNGSAPLHIAAGRGSVRLTALLMAAGADPHKENFEPLFYRDEGCCEGEEEEDEGYIPGTTPLSMAATPQRALCAALEGEEGGWEKLAHTLGLGLLVNAFRLSPRPAGTLLDSYEVSGGTIKELAVALKSVESGVALGLLQGALLELEASREADSEPQAESSHQVPPADLKLDARNDSGVCDSGVELSTV